MEIAASSALFLLRSSELAKQRVTDPRLRAFAASSIVEQRGIASQLNFAGRRLDLLPRAALMPADQALFDALVGSNDFDRAYLRQQRAVLARAGAIHRDFSEAGSSPTLRSVARMAEPVHRRQSAALEGLSR